MTDPAAVVLPGAVPGWPPECPDDGRELQHVLYKQVRHYRCPACRTVYYSVSARVGEARGRISLRYLKLLEDVPQSGAGIQEEGPGSEH